MSNSECFIVLLFSILIAFVPVGCASNKQIEVLTQYEVKVIEPPDKLYECPQIEEWPDPETLTNQQVANVIILLTKNLSICKNNINAIKAYIEKAKEIYIDSPSQ